MEGTPITAFLPCRKGSKRIKNKNSREFSGILGGLTTIKLWQLINCPEINTIVVSTNDPEVITNARKIGERSPKEIQIIKRPEHLCRSDTSTDSLIQYVPEVIKNGIILWTHVTSPFINENVYSRAIHKYWQNVLKGPYDSLMSVTKLQTFIWKKEGPINYERKIEKWPHTQTLPEYFEVNSGLFMNSLDNYIKYKDRIGNKTFFFETTKLESIDIDWNEDFKAAERIWHHEYI